MSLRDDVIRHTLKDDRGKDLKCLKDTNKHVEAGKDYERVLGEQKSFIHRLRKVLDDQELELILQIFQVFDHVHPKSYKGLEDQNFH